MNFSIIVPIAANKKEYISQMPSVFKLNDKGVSRCVEAVMRLELENVAAAVKDATVKDEMSVGKADVVIADLPCSGLGIISKKIDIKYHIKRE